MPNLTDLRQGGAQDGTEDLAVAVAEALAAVAVHFTATNPTGVLDETALLVCVSSEAYRLFDRMVGSSTQSAARGALEAAPERAAGITRGEYALLLRKAAVAHGYDWGDEDNRPVVPRRPIPGQRPAPDVSA